MNCPSCGAKNDADVRFCAECGTPIESSDTDNEATVIGISLQDLGSDIPDLSAMGEASEDKTMTVDHSEAEVNIPTEDIAVADMDADMAKPAPPVPEPEKPVSSARTPTPDSTSEPIISADAGEGGSTGSSGGVAELADSGQNKTMWIVIGVIALLFLCCCCCSLGFGGTIGSDPDVLEDLIRELSLVPGYLPFV